MDGELRLGELFIPCLDLRRTWIRIGLDWIGSGFVWVCAIWTCSRSVYYVLVGLAWLIRYLLPLLDGTRTLRLPSSSSTANAAPTTALHDGRTMRFVHLQGSSGTNSNSNNRAYRQAPPSRSRGS